MATLATSLRRNKRDQLADHFRQRLYQPLNSQVLHVEFGSAVRARISEINADPDGDLVIRNHTYTTPAGEVSLYTASPRCSLFGDISKDRSYAE